MAARFIHAVTFGVGGIAGYAAANNVEIPIELKAKYLTCASVMGAMGMVVAGGATMVSSATAGAAVMGVGAVFVVPVTLLAYTAGYQVGKIIHACDPDVLA